MTLLIDNYDSFSYNLVQLVGELDPDIRVIRNDEMTVAEIDAMKPNRIILSPGPGRPADAGVCEAVVRHFAGKVPVLGVCLGHQAICEAFGATVSYAKTLMHGKASTIRIETSCALFAGMPSEIQGARYHSLAAVESTLPDELTVTARTGPAVPPGIDPDPRGRDILKNFFQIHCIEGEN